MVFEEENFCTLIGEDENFQELGFLWLLLFLKLMIYFLSLISTMRRIYVLGIEFMLLELGKALLCP